MTTLFSIIESPTHPYFSPLYKKLGINESSFRSMRKAIKQIKKDQPDYITAEFFYGYGNNYAGINLSNLDVMLYTLQRYSPKTKVIVFVDKEESQYVEQLNKILPLYATLVKPVNEDQICKILKDI